MDKLYVYADFDWLAQPELVGEVTHERLRGSDAYGFRYAAQWLSRHGSLLLSDDIRQYPGPQYTQPGRDIFGCFADALPDRWGRTLLRRREQVLAAEQGRAARTLGSFDYLLGIDDFSRLGGLRFKREPDGEFINSDARLRVPPIADVRALSEASREIERSEERGMLPEERWLRQLVHPGTSLGGARPKACVTDERGTLFVAKFPSRSDDYDVALWEHLCHLLALKAGINAAATSVIAAWGKHHTLLSRRFDRTADGRRRHVASALTLLGLTDGDGWREGCGYLDIVDFMLRHCADVERNLRELYRRVAFNIAVGNSDDHFRNHAFLLTPRGWTLSPAYDINPSTCSYQSLLINGSSNEADMNLLREAAESYMLDRHVADNIISEVEESVSGWREVATRLGISPADMRMFESVLDKNT